MEVITEFFSKLGNLEELIKWGGLTVLIIIIFAETGLLIGFFLPGDSLLITAGLIAAQGYLDITVLNLSLIVAAIAGDQVGYLFGKKTGPSYKSKTFLRKIRRKSNHLCALCSLCKNVRSYCCRYR